MSQSLCQKIVDGSVQVETELLQVFTSEGKMEHETGGQTGAVSAVLQTL